MTIEAALVQAIVDAHKPLAASLGRIERHLQTLACAELARTLYGADALSNFVKQVAELRKADDEAFQALNQAHEISGAMSWDERVAKHGMADAKAQLIPVTTALERRKGTSSALRAFENEHPVLHQLMRLSTSCASS